MKKIISILLVMLLACTLFVGCGDSSKTANNDTETGGADTSEYDFGEYSAKNPLEIKLSHFAASETNQLHLLAAAFKEKVEKATGGAVEVTIYTGGVLGNDQESLDSVIAGTLEMAVNNTPIMSNYYEAFQVLDLPYLFEDYDQIYTFIESDVAKEMMDDFGEETGARMLCMQAVGYRNFDMCDKFINKPEDFKGAKVRVTSSPVYLSQYKAWGASPLTMAGTEVLTALQQGTIDGCDNVNNVTYSDGYYEYTKYITVSEHAVHFNGLTINNKLFESLTTDLQNLIQQAAVDAAVERSKALETENEDCLTKMKEAGAKVSTDIDKEAFKEAVQPVYDDFKSSHPGAKYLEAIQGLNK
jgi:tripartite ATP-independent transporter DctP family solute receptor